MFEATYISETPSLIIQNNKKIRSSSVLFTPLAALTIYSMIIPVIILDIWTTVYQSIYFSILDIPKIKKSDYIMYDRWQLNKLNILQRFNCVYCEYVNGLLAWAKGVSNQTEIYSCAIKHSAIRRGQNNQVDFYDYNKFK